MKSAAIVLSVACLAAAPAAGELVTERWGHSGRCRHAGCAGFQVVDSNMVLVNSIVWNNTPDEMIVTGAGEPLVSYTDVLGGWPGPGSLDADPLFARPGYWTDPDDPSAVPGPNDRDVVWIDGDYHLKSQAGRWDMEIQGWVVDEVTSPCIDSGDPLDSVGREPVPNGDIVNMGAYGGTAEASLGQ